MRPSDSRLTPSDGVHGESDEIATAIHAPKPERTERKRSPDYAIPLQSVNVSAFELWLRGRQSKRMVARLIQCRVNGGQLGHPCLPTMVPVHLTRGIGSQCVAERPVVEQLLDMREVGGLVTLVRNPSESRVIGYILLGNGVVHQYRAHTRRRGLEHGRK